MSEVDKRVVEMSFENKDFENGVRQSLQTLEKIEQTLSKMKLSDNFNKEMSTISRAASSIDLSGLNSAIEKVNYRFSTLGTVATTVLQNITSGVMNLGKNLITNTIGGIWDTIMSKGLVRAENIEQAKFMLEGLGLDVEEAMTNANDAVSGTAYGLDSAAKAAGQLAASGVELGSQMTDTLQSIAGVAAMTSSSYDDIAHLFETVAGSGRVMGDTLMMMNVRGLNAAHDLLTYFTDVEKGSAKTTDAVKKTAHEVLHYFDDIKDAKEKGNVDEAGNITEAGVRKVISTGIVTSEAFFAAMKEKYAEHAKEANETYSGAYSNFLSALGRIGADFQAPWMEFKRKFFVDIIPMINGIKKAMLPIYNRFNWILNIGGGKLAALTKPIRDIFGAIKTYEKGPKKGKLYAETEQAQHMINIFKEGAKIPYRLLKLIIDQIMSIRNAAERVFPALKLENIEKGLKTIKRLIPFVSLKDAFNGRQTTTGVKMITNAFTFLFNALNAARIGIKNFATIIKPIFKPIGALLNLIGRNIGDVFGGLNKKLEFFNKVNDSIFGQNKIKEAAKAFREFVKPITKAIKHMKTIKELWVDIFKPKGGGDSKSGLKMMSTLSDMKDPFANWDSLSTVQKGLLLIATLFNKIATSLRNLFGGGNKTNKDFKSMGESFVSTAKSIGDVFGKVFGKVFDFIKELMDAFNDLSNNGLVATVLPFVTALKNIMTNDSLTLVEKLGKLKEFFGMLGPAKTIVSALATVILVASNAFQSFKDKLVGVKNAVSPVVSKIKDFLLSIKPIRAAVDSIKGAIDKLLGNESKIDEKASQLTNTANNFKGIIEVFKNIGSTIGKGISGIVSIIVHNFKDAWDSAGEALGGGANTFFGKVVRVISTIFNGTKGVLGDGFKVIGLIVEKIKQMISDFTGSFETISGVADGSNRFQGIQSIIQSIVEFLHPVNQGASEISKGVGVVKGVSRDTKEITSAVSGVVEDVRKAMGGDTKRTTETVAEHVEGVGAAVSQVVDNFQQASSTAEQGQAVIDSIKDMMPSTLQGALELVTIGVNLFKKIIGALMSLQSLLLVINIKHLVQSTTDLIDGIGKKFGLTTGVAVKFATNLKDIGLAILMIAGAIFIIGNMNEAKFVKGVATVGVIAAAIIAMFVIVDKLGKSCMDISTSGGFHFATTGLLDMGVMLIGLGYAFKKVSTAVILLAGSLVAVGPQAMHEAYAMVLIFVGVVMGLLWLIVRTSSNAMNAHVISASIRNVSKLLIATGAGMMGFILALNMLLATVIEAEKIKEGSGISAFNHIMAFTITMMGLLMAFMVVAVASANGLKYVSLSSGKFKSAMPAIIGAIITLVGSIVTISIVVMQLSKVPMKKTIESFIEIGGLFAVLMASIKLMSGFVQTQSNLTSLKASMVAIGVLVGAVIAVSLMAMQLSKVENAWLYLLEAMIPIGAVVASIIILVKNAQGLDLDFAVSLAISIGAFVVAIGATVTAISYLAKQGDTFQEFIEIIAMLGAIVASLVVLRKITNMASGYLYIAVAIEAIAGSILIISYAIKTLSETEASINMSAFGQLAIMLGIIATTLGVLTALTRGRQAGLELVLVAAAIAAIAASILLLSKAVQTLDGCKNAINILTVINTTLIIIAVSIGGLITLLGLFAAPLSLVLTPMAAIVNGLGRIVQGLGGLALGLGLGIGAMGAFLGIISKIADEGPEKIASMKDSIVELFKAIGEGIHTVVKNLINNLWEDMAVFANDMYVYMPSIVSGIMEPITVALNEEAEKVWNGGGLAMAMKNMAEALWFQFTTSWTNKLADRWNNSMAGADMQMTGNDLLQQAIKAGWVDDPNDNPYRQQAKNDVNTYYDTLDEETKRRMQTNEGIMGNTDDGIGLDNLVTFLGNSAISSGVLDKIRDYLGGSEVQQVAADSGDDVMKTYVDHLKNPEETSKSSFDVSSFFDTENADFSSISKGLNQVGDSAEKASKKEEKATKTLAELRKEYHKKEKEYFKETGKHWKEEARGAEELATIHEKADNKTIKRLENHNKKYKKFIDYQVKWEKKWGTSVFNSAKGRAKALEASHAVEEQAQKTHNKRQKKNLEQLAKELKKTAKKASKDTKIEPKVKTKIDTASKAQALHEMQTFGKKSAKAYTKSYNEAIGAPDAWAGLGKAITLAFKTIGASMEKNYEPMVKQAKTAVKEASDGANKEAKHSSSAGKTFDDSVSKGIKNNAGSMARSAESVMQIAVRAAQTYADNHKVVIKVDDHSVKNASGSSGSSGGKGGNEKPPKGKSIQNGAFDSGVSTVQGMVNGINSAVPKLTTVSGKMASTIVTTFNSAMGINSPSKVMKKAGGYVLSGLEQGMFQTLDTMQSHLKPKLSKFLQNLGAYINNVFHNGLNIFDDGKTKGKNGKFENISRVVTYIREWIGGAFGDAFKGNPDRDTLLEKAFTKYDKWIDKVYDGLYKKLYKKRYKKYRKQGMTKSEAAEQAKKDVIEETTSVVQSAAYLWERSGKYAELRKQHKQNEKAQKRTQKAWDKFNKKHGNKKQIQKDLKEAKQNTKKAENELKAWEKKHGTDPKKMSKEEKEEWKRKKKAVKERQKEEKSLEENLSKWKEYRKKMKDLRKEGRKIDEKTLAGYINFTKKWRKAMKAEIKANLEENFVQDVVESFKVLEIAVPKSVSVLVGSMTKVIDLLSVAGQTASNSVNLLQSSMTKFTDILQTSFDTGISIMSDVNYDWMNPSEILYNMEQQILTYDEYVEKLAALKDRVSTGLYDIIKNMGYSSEGISYVNAFTAMTVEDINRAEAAMTKLESDEVEKYLDNMRTTMSDFKEWKDNIDNNLWLDERWVSMNGFGNAVKELMYDLREGGTETLTQIRLLKKMTKEELAEFLTLYSEQTAATNNTYMESIQKNSEAYAEWVTNLDKLRALLKAGKIDQAMFDELKAMGIDGRDYVKQIINMNDEQLSTLHSYFETQQEYNSHAVIDDMEQSLLSYQTWLDNMMSLKNRVSDEMYQQLNSLGYSGAATVANFAQMTAADLAQAEKLLAAQNAVNAASYMNDMEMQLVQYQKWINNLSFLQSNGIDRRIIEELQSQGVQSAEQVQAFVDLVNQGQAEFINSQYEDSVKMNTNNWINDLRKTQNEFKEYYQGLAQLENKGIVTASGETIKIHEGLMKELQSMGVDGLDYIRAFLSDSTGMALKEANAAFEKQHDLTKAQLILDMKENQQNMLTWSKNIEKMALAGFNRDFLTQLIEQGADATAEQVALFAEMSPEEVGEINHMWEDINKISKTSANELLQAVEDTFGDKYTNAYQNAMDAFVNSTGTTLTTLSNVFDDFEPIHAEDWGHDGSNAGASFINHLTGDIITDATNHSNTQVDQASNQAGESAGENVSAGFNSGFSLNALNIGTYIGSQMLASAALAQPNTRQAGKNVAITFDEALGKAMYENRATLVKDKLLEMFNTIISNQKEHIKEKGEKIGIFILKGIKQGIANQEYVDKLVRSIVNLANNVVTAMKKQLGINSPSKVFAELGGYTVEGFAKGVTDNITTSTDAINLMAGSAIDAATNALDGLDAEIQNRSTDIPITPVVTSDTALTGLDAIAAMSSNAATSIATLGLNNTSQVSAFESLQNQIISLTDAINNITDYTDTLSHIDLLVGRYLPDATTDVYLDGAKISQTVDKYMTDSINRRSASW